MDEFIYVANPARVIFGAGKLDVLRDELQRMGLERALVLATPQQEGAAQAIAERAGSRCAGIFAGAVMHTPVDVTAQALAIVEDLGVDGLISFGGGSTIGLGKAVALRTDLPQIAIPTTYAGSEMTPILGETAEGRKTTQTTLKVLPEVVIYDVELTMRLPVALSGVSGMNAIAHAVEALYAQNRNPIISMLATEGARALAWALPRIVKSSDDIDARSQAQYGAWLCGTCLGSVGMALHHKLCHTLGGAFGLPHAETHTVVLPYALAYNAPAAPDAIECLSQALGVQDPVQGLFDLGTAVGAPRSLAALGMPESGIDQAVELALANPYWNPRPLERNGVREVIARAWAGERPAPSQTVKRS